MLPGERRRGTGRWPLAALLCAALAGCRSGPYRANIEKNLMTGGTSPADKQVVAEGYLVGCPDVLQLRVEDRPEFDGRETVGPDGCITVGRYGKVRVEGAPLAAVAAAVAERVGASPDRVQVRVADFCSRHLILVGEVVGRPRTIPYQGHETVLDVLQRVGGITPGAEPTEVYVLRSHLADLRRPEVVHVDLQAIVLHTDPVTNIRVMPYDQIYIGETRQARVEKCIPPWARPVYQVVWDMLPNNKKAREHELSFTHFIRGLLTRPTETAPPVVGRPADEKPAAPR